MIDNWTLQDVEVLLSEGPDPQRIGELVLSDDRQSHAFSPLPAGVVQIDALLTLLTNIACFDSLKVDSEFLHTWQTEGGKLAPLSIASVVQAADYKSIGGELKGLRDAMLGELCVTPTLKKDLTEIRRSWAENQTNKDPYLSALVWGGAGMLARSHLTSTPYFGHPARRRLIRATRMFTSSHSAVERVSAFVDTQRAKMFRFRGEQLNGTCGYFLLPPIAVEIIEEASTIDDLVRLSIEMRDKYIRLREWLAEYQVAIDEEDERRQLKFENSLAKVAKAVEAKYKPDKSGSVGIQISVGFFKFDIPRGPVERIQNSFGVRATLSNLILESRGQKALSKLLVMLGEGKSAFGREILAKCSERYSFS
jgi:hypothetical protein